MGIDKIIIVSNYLPPRNSGAGQRAFNHARFFKKSGYKVNLVTQSPFGTNLLEFQKRNGIEDGLEKEDIIEIKHSYDLENQGLLKKILFALILLPIMFFQVLVKVKFGKSKRIVLHGFSTSLLVYLTILASAFSLKKVVSLMEITSLYPPGYNFHGKSGLKNKIFRYLYRKQLGLPTKIVTLSPANNKNYIRFMGHASNSELITNGIDTKKFHKESQANRIKLRKQLKLPLETSIIVYVGAITPHKKRVDIFVNLIDELSRLKPNLAIDFLFIGNNDRTETHRKLTAQLLETEDKSKNIGVNFTGHVENVSDYLKCADLYILPSEAEGLPNSVIEAMACGLPVLMNNIDGISNFILDDGENGFIVDNNSITDYVTIIDRLLSDLKEYLRISENAQLCIAERFTEEIVNKKYRLLYLKLLTLRGQ